MTNVLNYRYWGLKTKLFIIVWLSAISLPVWATNDTVFIKSHSIKNVRNIDSNGNKLLIRTNDYYLFYDGLRFSSKKYLDRNEKSFTWFNNISDQEESVYHYEYFINNKIQIDNSSIKKILPGKFSNNISIARLKNRLFICYKGKLLEYRIYDFYRKTYSGKSIRYAYCSKNFNIISTYSGIFFDPNTLEEIDSPMQEPGYSNGETNEIDGKIYLCSDDLYQLNETNNFIPIWNRLNQEKIRKLTRLSGKTYALFDNHVSLVNLNTKKEFDIQKIPKATDLEQFKNTLLISTEDGKLNVYLPKKSIIKFDFKTSIFDIQTVKNKIILSCNDGIRILNSHFKVERFLKLYKTIQTQNYKNSLFISTYSGLYFLPSLTSNLLFEVIPDVEFNKKALTVYDNFVYAGSVDGLYFFDLIYLNPKLIETMNSIKIDTVDNHSNSYLYYSIGLVIISILMIFVLFKRKKNKNGVTAPIRVEYTEEFFYDLITKKPHLLSVNDLSEELNVSIPTLHAKVKNISNLTPLQFLIQIKKKIALDLYNQGETLDNIAKRTGYSVRYVKSKLLKK